MRSKGYRLKRLTPAAAKVNSGKRERSAYSLAEELREEKKERRNEKRQADPHCAIAERLSLLQATASHGSDDE